MSHEGVIARELANEMADLCEGQPTASVYMAVAMLLAMTEKRAERPDREGLFKLMSMTMDDTLSKL